MRKLLGTKAWRSEPSQRTNGRGQACLLIIVRVGRSVGRAERSGTGMSRRRGVGTCVRR
jgi:hypothetical protein